MHNAPKQSEMLVAAAASAASWEGQREKGERYRVVGIALGDVDF